MILLDAYALVAYLAGEPAEAEVKALLHDGETAMTAVNLAETIDVSTRVCGVPADEVRAALSLLTTTELRVVPCDEGHAATAGELRATYYDARRCAVSVPDCFLLAAATESDSIATADPAVVAVARHEAVDVVRLPDSRGRRPR